MFMYGITGKSHASDAYPIRAFKVVANSAAEAEAILVQEGFADGLVLSEARELLSSPCGKVPGIDHEGPWPWPGKAA